MATNHTSEKIRSFIKGRITVSKRQGTWFRLNTQERSIINLALSLKVTFRSPDLLRAITSIMKRLAEVSDRSFGLLLRGSRLALAFSEAAVAWGNPSAKSWRTDKAYIAFLGRFFCRPPAGP